MIIYLKFSYLSSASNDDLTIGLRDPIGVEYGINKLSSTNFWARLDC